MKLIFEKYIEEVVQWVQYLHFESESSSSSCDTWQWVYTADETWLLDYFNVFLSKVKEVKDESALEFMIFYIKRKKWREEKIIKKKQWVFKNHDFIDFID